MRGLIGMTSKDSLYIKELESSVSNLYIKELESSVSKTSSRHNGGMSRKRYDDTFCFR